MSEAVLRPSRYGLFGHALLAFCDGKSRAGFFQNILTCVRCFEEKTTRCGSGSSIEETRI